jgi:hypothetical protein
LKAADLRVPDIQKNTYTIHSYRCRSARYNTHLARAIWHQQSDVQFKPSSNREQFVVIQSNGRDANNPTDLRRGWRYTKHMNLCSPLLISHFQDFVVTQHLWLGDCFSGIGYCVTKWRKSTFLKKPFGTGKGEIMKKHVSFILGLVFVASFASFASFASAADVAGAADGTVKHVSVATKTIVVKTADGTEHTFHFVGRTSMHGAEEIAKGAKDTFHGLKQGSHAVVHYTTKGT